MQVRYARFLRWTLEHRGKSLLGIALIVAVSFVPVMHTKTNMFGGDGGDEINVYYQWKGSYTVAQMSDEVRRVEDFLDANREKFHIKQNYSWFSEQGDAGPQGTFHSDDPDRIKTLTDPHSEALLKSARAENQARQNRGGQGGAAGPGCTRQPG